MNMEKLKVERANSKRSFTRIKRNLMKHMTDGAEVDLVRDCWEEMKTAWSEVELKHNEYIALLPSEDEIEREEPWIAEVYGDFSNSKKMFFNFIKDGAKSVKKEAASDKTASIKQPELQKLKMPLFSGSQDDVMSFNDFLHMYDDLIGENSTYSDTAKLMYLKSYLRGNALDTIKHLSNDEKNYDIARKFLIDEYLDTDVIVEEHIRKLHDLTPPSAKDFPALRSFFNTARASIYELKAFGYDGLQDDTLGSKIVSFMICEKLPTNFKIKLSTILQTDFPSTRQLLENYNTVLKSLMKTSAPAKQETKPAKQETKANEHQGARPKPLKTRHPCGQGEPDDSSSPSVKSTLRRFHTGTESAKKPAGTSPPKTDRTFKPCKLCDGAHSMLKCSVYTTPQSRIRRLKDLDLCTRCSGVHKVVECKGQSSGLTYPCTICNSKQHISAVCVVKTTENNQLQSGLRLMCNNIHKGQSVILPSMSVIMHVNNGEICERVRCMIDMGSQASYISEDLATRLGFKSDSFKTEYKVKTCIGVKERSYSSATCDVIFTPTATARHSFLVDPEMSLEYEIPGIKSLVQTLKANGVRMADSFFNDITSDTIGDFDCLLGSDIIGALKPLKSVDLGMGTALEVQDGLILFGDVDSYLNRRSQDEVTGRDESVDGHQGPGDRDASEPAEENNEGFGGLQRGKPS